MKARRPVRKVLVSVYSSSLLIFVPAYAQSTNGTPPIGKLPVSRQQNTSEKNSAGTTHSASPLMPKGVSSPRRHITSVKPGSESFAVRMPRGNSSAKIKVSLKEQVPGTSPYKALGKTAGVDFTSTDPLGVDSYGANLFVRGFFANQIGVAVDGMPLDDQTYQSLSGMSLASTMITDDIGGMTASQGAGDLTLGSTNNLGGSIRITSSDPNKVADAKINQTFGSYGSYRTFVRLDSGALNESGTKFYTAYARTDAGMWEGNGRQFMQQVDAKLVQPIGKHQKLSAFFNWTDLEQDNYPDLSMAMIKHIGWRVPYLSPDYGKAWGIASQCNTPGAASPAYPGTTPGASDAAGGACNFTKYNGGQNERNIHGTLSYDYEITPDLTWKTVAYGHSQQGSYSYSDFSTPTDPWNADPKQGPVNTTNGSPMSEEVWQNWQRRFGITSKLQMRMGNHHVELGIWYENNNQHTGLGWYPEGNGINAKPVKATGPYNKYGGAFLRSYNYAFRTNTVMPYIQDSFHPWNGLTFTYGVRAMIAKTTGGANYNNTSINGTTPLPNGSLTATNGFLPHFNIDYRLNKEHEFYIDIAKNMRAYEVSGYGVGNSLFSVQNQDIFNLQKARTKPSTSWTFMGGYRFTKPWVQVNATIYDSIVRNQLWSATAGTPTDPMSAVYNFGRTNLLGATGMITLTPFKGFSFTNSLSYNKGTYDTDATGYIVNGGNTQFDRQHTKGKNIVNYPSWMYKVSLSYKWRNVTTYFDANYYGERYYSFTNNMHVPSYWVANAGMDILLDKFVPRKNVKISFNVYNLFNNKYIATMGEENNPMSNDYQSMERGAPREFFGTVSAAF